MIFRSAKNQTTAYGGENGETPPFRTNFRNKPRAKGTGFS
jgi:hypothetical protein